LRIVLIHIILEIPPQIKLWGSSLVNALPTRFHTSCWSVCLLIAL
jgi:hypothetical protein